MSIKTAVRALSELGPDVVLAPERHVAGEAAHAGGVPLGELVVERRERVDDLARAVVLDTTHARDGVLEVAAALASPSAARSAKKLACVGDVVVSRLRPYLRQIALVHPGAVACAPGRALALSTEFYVFAPRRAGEDLAYLLPWLLGAPVQSVLAAAQEGGHHPRVPRPTMLALRVPEEVVARRVERSAEVRAALGELYRAMDRVRLALG